MQETRPTRKAVGVRACPGLGPPDPGAVRFPPHAGVQHTCWGRGAGRVCEREVLLVLLPLKVSGTRFHAPIRHIHLRLLVNI